MRVLLTEGSSLTSRQVAGRLGALGHQVEILSSTPVCLTRFTRAVHSVHAVPRFGLDPFAWLEAAERIVRERKIDVLFPTHEQVTVLSARQTRLTVPTIVPPFASLKRVQDRIAAFRTLTEVGTPQPETVVVTDAGDVSRVVTFPAFIKKPISTASSGVRRVCDAVELENAVRILGLRPSGLIVQTQAKGPLIMIQAVAQRGQLVAHHACQRLREGIGAGASLKESLVFPGLRGMLARLVTFLDWHGGLSMDAIVTENGPLVIDVNPRLVEPANALAAGVDLVGAMLSIAGGNTTAEQPPGRPGVRTHQTLIAVLGAAAQHGTRRAIVTEAYEAMFSRSVYSASREELTPLTGDGIAALPVAAALAATLVRPGLWRMFHTGAVGPYAVTAEAWNMILADADSAI